MVEKKTAAEFGFLDGDPATESRQSEASHDQEEAEAPLLKSPPDQTYIIPATELPAIIQSYPILYCFKDIRMLAANWTTLIQAILLGGLDATVPLVGEEYYGFNSLQTGLLFIPVLLPGLVLGPVAGWITDRQGPKRVVVAGYGLLVPIFVSLRTVQPGGSTQVLIYSIILTLCGTCLAATSPPALVESTMVIEKYYQANPEGFGPNGPYAQISGMTGMMYNAGTALGSLLAGALKDVVGYGNMNLVNAGLALVTALLGFFFTGETTSDLGE